MPPPVPRRLDLDRERRIRGGAAFCLRASKHTSPANLLQPKDPSPVSLPYTLRQRYLRRAIRAGLT